MKADKIIFIVLLLGTARLLKPEQEKSVFGRKIAKTTEPTDSWKASDEEIMSGLQFTGPIHERARYGLPRLKRTHRSFKDISKHYAKWASVDKLGAAAEFKPSK